MEPPLNPDIPQEREKLRRLFRVKRIEGEMMKDRGYSLDKVWLMKVDRNFVGPLSLTQFQDPNYTFEEFLQFRQQNGIFQSRREFSGIYINQDRERTILVLYLGNDPGKMVSSKDFRIVHDFIGTQQYRNIVLITETGLGPDSFNSTRRMIGYNVEIFLDIELAFNPLKHVLAPVTVKHIPAEYVPNWAREEGLENDVQRLPMILDLDPIAKWYGAKPFDVFQTTLLGTENDTIGFYRIVRQAPVVRKSTVKK